MDAMNLHIEPAASEPIYRQIIGQVVRLVAAGQCPPGTRLPSVRDVAAAHAINPMTVSKAYAQLEAQGVLERQRGKGMVVAAQPQEQRPQAERLSALAPALHALALQARQLGLPPAAVLEALRACLEEGTEGTE